MPYYQFIRDSIFLRDLVAQLKSKGLLGADQNILLSKHKPPYKHLSKVHAAFEKPKKSTFFFTLKWFTKIDPDDRIIIHLLDLKTSVLIGLMGKRKKIAWVFWGSELFHNSGLDFNLQLPETKKILPNIYLDTAGRFKKIKIIKWIDALLVKIADRIKYAIFHSAITKVDYIYHYNQYDIELLSSRTPFRGKQVNFMYPRLVDFETHFEDMNLSKPENDQINILVGVSSSPSNNHVDIFKMLPKSERVHVWVTMAYGGRNPYRNEVLSIGEALFGNNFHPITHFMPKQEYLDFIVEMDLIIHGSLRSFGMGNITTQLAMSKSLCLMDNNPCSNFLLDEGFYIRRLKNNDSLTLEEILHLIKDSRFYDNAALARRRFANKYVTRNYEDIFSGKPE